MKTLRLRAEYNPENNDEGWFIPEMQNWHDYLQYAAVKLLIFNFLSTTGRL
jgi:hypothetical protein